MNGAHDLGGMHGFGTVVPEPNEPVFHADWEKRAFALTLAMATPGAWNIDMSRFARENRPPAEYLAMSYYQVWFAALETMLKERGLVGDDEIGAGHALHAPKPVARILSPGDVAQVLYRGEPTERATDTKPAFKAGDTVRAKNINPLTHTRLPRYVRGHEGMIERVIGCHVFPDSNARGAGENPQWLYTVRFEGRELWGEQGDPRASVSVDAWEPYLEPASCMA
jgi:nitrile hydratase beta subunit